VEVLENGIHLDNVHEDHLQRHFHYTFRHLCGDR
jgi:hypothetical protein